MSISLQDRTENTRAQEAVTSAPVAYIMSRFPKLTETFVLYEILEAERCGAQVEVYPLRREKYKQMHAEAEDVVARAHFTPWLSMAILFANVQQFCRTPMKYLGTLAAMIWANLGSLNYLSGAVLYYPKSVFMAVDMKRRGVRHVHAHFASHPAATAFVIHRLAGIPFSFTAHGSDLHCDRHMLTEKVAEAASVVTISNYNRELILKECGERFDDKVHVIHCGVDTTQFRPRSMPTVYDQGTGPMSIVCVGTLHEVKGQSFLLEACSLLKQQGIEVCCNLIGGGPDFDMLESKAKELGIDQQVVLHGPQTRDQVLAHLQQADVLAAPSVPTSSGRREGIPVVLMEAMASGVPCVASRLSGIPELITDGCGLLATPKDAGDIAAALKKLHESAELRQQLAISGRQRVQDEFDLSKNAQTLMEQFTA